MSDKHTPGRLNVRGGYSIYTTDGTPVADTCLTASIPDNDEANARRLVACWNALEDLPQAALDGGWTRAGLEAYGLKMMRQRDELLEALKGALEMIEIITPFEGDTVRKARAVIAKAEASK